MNERIPKCSIPECDGKALYKYWNSCSDTSFYRCRGHKDKVRHGLEKAIELTKIGKAPCFNFRFYDREEPCPVCDGTGRIKEREIIGEDYE
jgi:hypothetical protein